MAIPVFGGMLAEPFTSFIVPTLYSAYLEFKMRFGLRDPLWEGTEDNCRGRKGGADEGRVENLFFGNCVKNFTR